MRAISACLLGVACRYDGRSKACAEALRIASSEPLLPICPEQLGGLATPRSAARIHGGDGSDVLAGRARVIDARGVDVSDSFLRGAHEVLRLCRVCGIGAVLLKARSPSCGLGRIHGEGGLIDGDGVTAALLKQHGIAVRLHAE